MSSPIMERKGSGTRACEAIEGTTDLHTSLLAAAMQPDVGVHRTTQTANRSVA